MSWSPYGFEAEERRDSERFADASVFDGPDPSEYMDYPEDEDDSLEVMIERPIHFETLGITDTPSQVGKPGMIDKNAILKGLLGMLFAVLAGLMFWILFGEPIMRWVLL